MFRRQIPDRVNPRNVLPSRHTLFIRGLPGSTDVTKVKEYFSSESNSKCSVDFFSTSDDKKRLSVAIRFKTHDLAKEMLSKYNNKLLMGFPVEMSWFKDFKKARAKVFEEQRQAGNRPFQRSGFRNFRNDRNVMAVSPNGFNDGRRMRAGSSSSGGNPSGGMNRQRFSRSRSRSFTGSSSRSMSQSGRSTSASPHLRRLSNNPADNMKSNMRGFSDNQATTFDDRRMNRTQSGRSVSVSSSTSRSSAGLPARHNSGSTRPVSTKGQQNMYQHNRGNASPLNYNAIQRDQRISGSNPKDYSSFTNAPAPDVDGGSSLVSGLIQLKRRNQVEPHRESRPRRRSIGSSSSGHSGVSNRGMVGSTVDSNRQHGLSKRMSSISPAYGGMAQLNYKSRTGLPDHPPLDNDDTSEFPRRKRQKQLDRSPRSISPGTFIDRSKTAELDDVTGRRRTLTTNQEAVSQSTGRTISKSGRTFHDESVSSEDVSDIPTRRMMRTPPSDAADWRASRDVYPSDLGGWPRSSHGSGKHRKSSRVIGDSPRGQSVESDASAVVESFRNRPKGSSDPQDDVAGIFKESTEEVIQEEKPDDTFDLIRQHKESLAQDYKRDCEAFTTVVRTLINLKTFHHMEIKRANFSPSAFALLFWVVVIFERGVKTMLMNVHLSLISVTSIANVVAFNTDIPLFRQQLGSGVPPCLIDGHG